MRGSGDRRSGTLYRLALSPTGAVTARTPVAGGANAWASDYDGNRLVFIRSDTDWRTAQVWLREPTGASRSLTAGHLGAFSPGRTAVTISRFVAEGDPESMDPEHSGHSVVRLADGHVFPLAPHRDGEVDSRIRNSSDGRSLWMFTRSIGEGFGTLWRYDPATDSITRFYSSGSFDDAGYCGDFEILPSGANALLACGNELLTVRLATGKVTHRTAVPSGLRVDQVDGRLNATTLLLSVRSGSRQQRQLAALDLTTMRTRTLPGTAGYTNAVAAY
jgi:hypothetical protein